MYYIIVEFDVKQEVINKVQGRFGTNTPYTIGSLIYANFC